MQAYIKGSIYSKPEDKAEFDPGMGEAFDLIKISDSFDLLQLYLSRKQVKQLLHDMLQHTPLLACAEEEIRQAHM